MLTGFFLPWIHGSAEFAARDFTGADLARLVRNFEIVASSSQEAGKLRVTAVVIYLAPALAVNGAIWGWLAPRRLAVSAQVLAGVYEVFLLCSLVLLSVVDRTELERVLGGLMSGYVCSWVGAMALLLGGVLLGGNRSPDATVATDAA